MRVAARVESASSSHNSFPLPAPGPGGHYIAHRFYPVRGPIVDAELFRRPALLPSGWAARVRIEVDETGDITAATPDAPASGAERLHGVVVPGMPNLHSHAFQRAMAGLAERAGPEGDSFWSWREVMYRFLARLSPDDIEAIAAQLYVELLKHGYTAVAEFHYLHNDPSGGAYENRGELADRILAAAGATGIGLTLLPVLYQTSQFGGARADRRPAPLHAGDRRFPGAGREAVAPPSPRPPGARRHRAALAARRAAGAAARP